MQRRARTARNKNHLEKLDPGTDLAAVTPVMRDEFELQFADVFGGQSEDWYHTGVPFGSTERWVSTTQCRSTAARSP